jgi:hypothetical protein
MLTMLENRKGITIEFYDTITDRIGSQNDGQQRYDDLYTRPTTPVSIIRTRGDWQWQM